MKPIINFKNDDLYLILIIFKNKLALTILQ